MVAGHLQEKKGYYYMVLNLKDENGHRKSKWIPTGLPTKGNKKKAETMLLSERQKYTTPILSAQSRMRFSDYMLYWLRSIRSDIEESTYAGYETNVLQRIVPYFHSRDIRLYDLKAIHIQEFYLHCQEHYGVSNNTLIHYHANLTSALKYAVNMDLIPVNPMNKVKRPKMVQYVANYYSLPEVEALLETVKDDPLAFPVLMAAFYGLRRSEIVGLRWQAIDFENNRITINHTVVQTKRDRQNAVIAKDRTKNHSSCRSLPLVPQFKTLLSRMKLHQEQCKSLCGNAYHQSDYVFVNDIGTPYTPNYITQHFSLILKKNNLRKIRFHDLRHGCASLLLKNGVSMREIQEWLGHSSYSTTAKYYAHLDTGANEITGKIMADTLNIDCMQDKPVLPLRREQGENCPRIAPGV